MAITHHKHILTLFLLVSILLSACKSTKYVNEGDYLLHSVGVTVNSKAVKPSELTPYIKQTPNHKTFGLFTLPLFLYNLSGSDTTKWVNRSLRKMGDSPVLYDSVQIIRSQREIAKALDNKGFVNSHVEIQKQVEERKMDVNFHVTLSNPYNIREITYNIPNSSIAEIVAQDSASSLLKGGELFDRSVLESERSRITSLLQNQGYYAFNKEYINYTADSTHLGNRVDLQLNINPIQSVTAGEIKLLDHNTYTIRNVFFVTGYDPMSVDTQKRYMVADTVMYNGYTILYGEDRYVNEETLVNNCYILPGELYRAQLVDNTYSAFSRLRMLKYVNIQFAPASDEKGEVLDCYILLTQGKTQTLSSELEGTNSAGDLGFALGLTYQHRNLLKGSQTFTTKLRGAYESLSGNLSGLINNNYTEIGGETGISFPQFIFPFIHADVRKQLRATTEFTLNVNYQQRPEYTRLIAGGGWRYNWMTNQNRWRHLLDLVDVSYIYLPDATDDFMQSIDSIAVDNPMLRYSYENHFIMRTGYTLYTTNLNQSRKFQRNVYTLRVAGEVAGNTLNAISHLTQQKRGEYGDYSIFGIRYAQYAKLDADYSYTINFDTRNTLAFRSGMGVALPYGNSEIIPFEKRYFAGGANSVRGWSVRSLGPGRYKGTNPTSDFMNQCGDIRLDLNAEYRSKLIWILEMALFADAGNVWTIQDYSSQPNGAFRFNEFYKEIALSYGVGVRLDFDFFLLRFDLGIKCYDPSRSAGSRWVVPYKKPLENGAIHFAVGYPF